MAGGRKRKYVNNEDLLAEVIKSKKVLKENPDQTVFESLTPELTNMLRKLVDEFGNSGKYRNYSFIEDMKADAILALGQNTFKFDETKYSNAFAYYTQIVYHNFMSFLDKEKKVRDIRDDLLEESGIEPSSTRKSENERLASLPYLNKKALKELKIEMRSFKNRIEDLSELISAMKKPEIPPDAESRIAVLLDIKEEKFLNGRDHAQKCIPTGYTWKIYAGMIGDTAGMILDIKSDDGTSNIKRLLTRPDVETKIAYAMVMTGLAIHRELMNKTIRDKSGDNPISAYRVMPTTNQGTIVDPYRGRNLEYTERGNPWGPFEKD